MPGEDLERLEFHGDMGLSFDKTMFMILSSILATAGLLSNSVPVLIGAMMIAPAFDTVVAVPFGLLNRNWSLVKQGAISSVVLFATSFAVCSATAWLLLNALPVPLKEIEPEAGMLAERLTYGPYSVLAALAAGAGGAIAIASNKQPNLIGVAVALALVPALAAAAIGFQYGDSPGFAGIMLFLINVGGIIVSGFFVLALRVHTGRAEEAVSRANSDGPEDSDR